VGIEVPAQDRRNVVVWEPGQKVGETMTWAIRDEVIEVDKT
jgi:D-hexose-6-phosphate mutarotase